MVSGSCGGCDQSILNEIVNSRAVGNDSAYEARHARRPPTSRKDHSKQGATLHAVLLALARAQVLFAILSKGKPQWQRLRTAYLATVQAPSRRTHNHTATRSRLLQYTMTLRAPPPRAAAPPNSSGHSGGDDASVAAFLALHHTEAAAA